MKLTILALFVVFSFSSLGQSEQYQLIGFSTKTLQKEYQFDLSEMKDKKRKKNESYIVASVELDMQDRVNFDKYDVKVVRKTDTVASSFWGGSVAERLDCSVRFGGRKSYILDQRNKRLKVNFRVSFDKRQLSKKNSANPYQDLRSCINRSIEKLSHAGKFHLNFKLQSKLQVAELKANTPIVSLLSK